MIVSILKECCYKCRCPDVEVDNVNLTYDYGIEKETRAVIKCTHQKVCKYYNEDDSEDN